MFKSNVLGVSDSSQTQVQPLVVERNHPQGTEVLIDVLHCGICHSDVELLSNNWGITKYPCVPGHEAIGVVSGLGTQVSAFKVGDVVGVGCMIGSCSTCFACSEGWENHCEGANGPTMTYNGFLMPKTKQAAQFNTFGAWSDRIVVREHFVVPIPEGMDLATTAPLMCPGTATYGPLKRLNITTKSKIGILGLGGPGHLAVQFAKAMGAHNVTAFTTHAQKREASVTLGADQVILSSDENAMREHSRSFDHILSTIPVPFDPAPYLALLKRRGSLTVMGLLGPFGDVLNNFNLACAGLSIIGSMIGSVAQTKECVQFCLKHKIVPSVEVVGRKDINTAIDRLKNADVRFRFVVDMAR